MRYLVLLVPFVLASIAFSASQVAAQNNAVRSMPMSLSAPSTPATHRAAAEELMRLTMTDALVSTIITTMVDALVQNIPAGQRFRTRLVEFFSRHLTVDEMVRRMAPHYVGALSELELRQLTWFYRTPVGAHSLEVLPQLSAQGAQAGQAIVQEHMDELQQLLSQ